MHTVTRRGRLAVRRRGGLRMERNRYLDLLRPVAIGSSVVYGHWLLSDFRYSGVRFSALNPLDYIAWGACSSGHFR